MTTRNRLAMVACLVGCSVLAGACVTISQRQPAKVADRGIRVNHDVHAAQGVDCTSCHESLDTGAMGMPTHDVCSVCHEIDVDNPTPEACGLCHTNENFEIIALETILSSDILFSHAPHETAGVTCAECHTNPNAGVVQAARLKPFCMDCHGSRDVALNECAVCHNAIRADVVPQFRNGARIPHDAPDVWMTAHGREAQVDPAYCALCHSPQQQFCDECHAKTAPASHTIAWERRTHGIQASWDRQSCAVCHEEESCMQCHRNVEPVSHRPGFGAPLDGHCVSCHFPPTDTGCVVCHESIDHKTAPVSPHRLNIYPANCRLCHPGGLPNRAPHPVNSTVQCQFCH
jgi:hypothetical protein